MPTSFALRATTKSWRAANRAGAISCGASHSRVKSACKPTHSPTCNSPNHRRRPSRDGPPRSQHCVLSPSRQDTKARLRGTRNARGSVAPRRTFTLLAQNQTNRERASKGNGERQESRLLHALFVPSRSDGTPCMRSAPRFVVARQRKLHICQYMRNSQVPSICGFPA